MKILSLFILFTALLLSCKKDCCGENPWQTPISEALWTAPLKVEHVTHNSIDVTEDWKDFVITFDQIKPFGGNPFVSINTYSDKVWDEAGYVIIAEQLSGNVTRLERSDDVEIRLSGGITSDLVFEFSIGDGYTKLNSFEGDYVFTLTR